MALSNYPPGHPTGVSRGEPGEIYYCERCLLLLDEKQTRRDAGQADVPTCPDCKTAMERAECDCGKPATHIDEDRAVNAAEAFCDDHGMR